VPARREETGIAAAAAAAADWRISVGGFGVSKLEESVRAEQEPRAVLFSFFFLCDFLFGFGLFRFVGGPSACAVRMAEWGLFSELRMGLRHNFLFIFSQNYKNR
jgi:hypothetical protein